MNKHLCVWQTYIQPIFSRCLKLTEDTLVGHAAADQPGYQVCSLMYPKEAVLLFRWSFRQLLLFLLLLVVVVVIVFASRTVPISLPSTNLHLSVLINTIDRVVPVVTG